MKQSQGQHDVAMVSSEEKGKANLIYYYFFPYCFNLNLINFYFKIYVFKLSQTRTYFYMGLGLNKEIAKPI